MHKVLPKNAILIPDNAKRVFEGNLFDVYQWPQKLFDGRTETYEMLKRPDTVQIVLIKDNKILLVNDRQPGRPPLLYLPRGRVNEEDESWRVAAQRELREETGYVCDTWRLLSVAQPLAKIEWFIPTFLAQDVRQQLPQQLDPGGEHIEFKWLDYAELREEVFTSKESTLRYMVPHLSGMKNLDEFSDLPTFEGLETDR